MEWHTPMLGFESCSWSFFPTSQVDGFASLGSQTRRPIASALRFAFLFYSCCWARVCLFGSIIVNAVVWSTGYVHCVTHSTILTLMRFIRSQLCLPRTSRTSEPCISCLRSVLISPHTSALLETAETFPPFWRLLFCFAYMTYYAGFLLTFLAQNS